MNPALRNWNSLPWLECEATEGIMVWLNILSLDATLVALLWQDFFAHCLGVRLGPAPRWVLGLSVWMAYVADRWLDSWRIPAERLVSPRHRFARRYRVGLACIWGAVLLATVAAAFRWLKPTSLYNGALLLGVVGLYYIWNHWPGRERPWFGIKEPAVGFLFACGTLLFVYSDSKTRVMTLGPAGVMWAGLCFLNCYGIACWEKERDSQQAQESMLTRWPGLARYFRKSALGWALGAAALGALRRNDPLAPVYGAVAAGAVALSVLDNSGGGWKTDTLHLLADVALLSPAFFWWA